MNLRYWDRRHTFGLLIGLLSVLMVTPLVLFIYTLFDHSKIFTFTYYWEKLFYNENFRVKTFSLAVIPNLLWFYLSLNKRNYNFAMGVILASAIFIPYIIYVNYF
jgi:hypothetical protein